MHRAHALTEGIRIPAAEPAVGRYVLPRLHCASTAQLLPKFAVSNGSPHRVVRLLRLPLHRQAILVLAFDEDLDGTTCHAWALRVV